MLRYRSGVTSGLLLAQAAVSAHPRTGATARAPQLSRSLVMMLDTGARFSVVANVILRSLGVAAVGDTPVRTSMMQQVVYAPVYRITIGLELADMFGQQTMAEFPLNVIARPAPPPNLPSNMAVSHDGLLGLDFLDYFRFVYDGPAKRFELACDFVPSLAK